MFVTTHYMDEAERCSHVGYIYLGKLIVSGRPDELKGLAEVTPAGTRRFEVTCGSPAAALSRARAVAGVRDATMFGSTLHVMVDDGVSEGALLAAIAPGDGEASARPIAPSLEDVFVLMSRRQGAAA
jgi:ABC-type multidrug transport system ATPase subunit